MRPRQVCLEVKGLVQLDHCVGDLAAQERVTDKRRYKENRSINNESHCNLGRAPSVMDKTKINPKKRESLFRLSLFSCGSFHFFCGHSFSLFVPDFVLPCVRNLGLWARQGKANLAC